MEMQQMVK